MRLAIQRKSELKRFWPEWRWPVRQKIFKVGSVGALFWLLFWARKKVTKIFNSEKHPYDTEINNETHNTYITHTKIASL